MLTKKFIIGAGMTVIGLIFSALGVLIIGVPLGIIGAGMAIIEMIKSFK